MLRNEMPLLESLYQADGAEKDFALLLMSHLCK